MIDVLEQIDFLKSLLSDDTPTHIKESIEKKDRHIKIRCLSI